ncbi:hypothetical protein IWQ56_000343, partial [Coemansia nantahalensis]
MEDRRYWISSTQAADACGRHRFARYAHLQLPFYAIVGRHMAGFLMRDQTDAFWFRREAACQLTAANARRAQSVRRCAALWAQMVAVQAWHRRFVVQCDAALHAEPCDEDDPALPLYGESGSEGEFSDGLQREMAGEREDAARRAARAADVEQRRVAMVGAVVQEMVEKYARDWRAS